MVACSCPPVREEGIVISIISSIMQKERDTFENYCVSGEEVGQQQRLGTSFFVAVTVSEFITEAGRRDARQLHSRFLALPRELSLSFWTGALNP